MTNCRVVDDAFVEPCQALASEIEYCSPAGRFKGFFSYVLHSRETRQPSRSGVGIKTTATLKGVLLSFCPWCGVNIGKPFQDPESDA